MGFWNRLKAAWNTLITYSGSTADKDFAEWLGIDTAHTPKKALSETTYYTCLKVLSESMGKLPLKYFQHDPDKGVIAPPMSDAALMLCRRPNAYLTATTFWTQMEMYAQHYGNAYALIDRGFLPEKYGGQAVIKGFYLMHPSCVSILIDDKGLFGTIGNLYYQYTDPQTGEQYTYHSDDILHAKTWYSKDGIVGEPVRKILASTIAGAESAAECETSLFANGMHASMVLQYAGSLEEDKVGAIQKKFADKLTGSQAAGKVIPIPIGLQLQKLDQSFVDSDFFNLKKYSALQIGAAFGIKPSSLNNYENSKYASSESEALAFLVDTLMYRLKMYEDEINSKVLTPEEQKNGYYYKFNEKAILRTNNADQSSILKNYVQGGVYTPNEARRLLDLPKIEGGDTLLINGSYVPITEAGAAYSSKAGGK